MPTAPKMVAAVLLAMLGVIVSGLIQDILPENTDMGWFFYINAALGFLCGWMIVGTRAGRGNAAAISNGFTGVVALVFWGLFIQSVNDMVRLAMRHRFNGPVEAFAAIFEIAVDFGRTVLVPEVLLTLAVGGVILGLLTEVASRHWR